MPTVYLTEQRTLVRLRNACLEVQIPEDAANGRSAKTVEIPLLKIDDVVVLGEATITASAIGALMQQGVTICYLGPYGQYRGMLTPESSKHGQLRIAQYEAHIDEGKQLKIAREFVRGKLSNMRTMLMRQNRVLMREEIEGAIQTLREALDNLDKVTEVPSLLGVEGAASAAYFAVFGLLLRKPLGFTRRLRRPPPDPVNALLSFGYSLLTQKCVAAAQAVGLDAYIGFLHSTHYGRPAVGLDLVEEFRPIITDSVVLTALNRNVITEEDFVEEVGSCRLTDRGRRAFLEQFEQRLAQEVEHPVFGYKTTYRRCLELQARLLGKAVLGDIPAYPPFRVR